MGATLATRLAVMPVRDLPLEHQVTIRWNEHAVPFVEAESDADLAFALGLVHCHLREGLLALGKRLAYGRLAEIIGPPGRKIDHTLRVIGFARAAELVEPHLPNATRAWMQRFVDGLNHYQDHVRKRPPEYRLLGLRRERWTIRDLLAIGRVAGTDINWTTYFGLAGLRTRADWPEIWERALHASSMGITSFSADDQQAVLAGLLEGFSRSGSNSVVVAPSRSASGAAMLAADPHLSITLPNLWILAGVRSPSLNAVGLMPAGLPIFGLGRSAHMTWGGTNMRAAASDLYALPPDEELTTRIERLRTRFARTKSVAVRESRLGPVISDAPHFRALPGERVALRWAGREPSDEIGAFLAVARARTPEAFRAALASYGVGGQNMQFADVAGNIGQVMAVWLPRRRKMKPASLVLDPADPDNEWQGLANAATLPWALNPGEGYLASANNPPAELDVPVSYFFMTSERVERLEILLGARERLTIDDLKALQNDVTSPASLRLKDQLVAAIDAAGLAGAEPQFLARLRAWDGRYEAQDSGPVAFETLLFHVVERVQAPRPEVMNPVQRRDWSTLVAYLRADLDALPDAERRRVLAVSLRKAARDARRYRLWGAMHRMRVQHPAARIPVIGRWFRFGEYGASGSRETVMKAAHGLVRKRHAATYGSQARFLADMGDPDANWAVLLGGQDGWIGSANFADQMPMWRGRGYIRLPMTQSIIEREFPIVQTLHPQ